MAQPIDVVTETPGGPLRVVQAAGAGTPVLFVHGMASDALAWIGKADDVARAGGRAMAYDRRGYGHSPAPEPYGATTVAEQAEDLTSVLHNVGYDAAVLAGDGFGALVALDVALRHPERVIALALGNPPLLQFAPDGAEWLQTTQLALQAAIRAGGPAAAVEQWLGGRAKPDALARAKASAVAFFADWAGLGSLAVTRAQLRALRVPAAVTAHADAPPHIAAGADALADLLPDCRVVPDGDLVAAVVSLL